MQEATQHMARLIDDLLGLARVSRGDLRREQVDLTGLARRIIDKIRAGDAAHPVEAIISDGLAARGDSRLLEIMLHNLLENAWKFSANKPQPRIEFGRGRHGDREVFMVRDNGAGFDMAHVSKLFRPFQRLHSTAEFAGTGIGLATVQRIVHRHGGQIWAEGEIDRGATFYFTLGEAAS